MTATLITCSFRGDLEACRLLCFNLLHNGNRLRQSIREDFHEVL